MTNNRIVHFIPSIDNHGAQQNLFRFISRCPQNISTKHVVVTLKKPSSKNQLFHSELLKYAEVHTFLYFLKLFFANSSFRNPPSINCTIFFGWMYHGILLACFFHSLGLCSSTAVYTIRHGEPFHKGVSIHTRLAIIICLLISRFTTPKFLVNSHNGITAHANIGFNKSNLIYWPNFLPSITPLDLGDRQPFAPPLKILYPARYHPQKNHKMALEVLYNLVFHHHLPVELTLIGDNIIENISHLIGSYPSSISKHLLCLDNSSEINSFYRSTHLVISTSSFGEGLQNILIESIMHRKPIFSTSVGDATQFLGSDFLTLPTHSKTMADQIALFYNSCINSRLEIPLTYRKLLDFQYSRLTETCNDTCLFRTFASIS